MHGGDAIIVYWKTRTNKTDGRQWNHKDAKDGNKACQNIRGRNGPGKIVTNPVVSDTFSERDKV